MSEELVDFTADLKECKANILPNPETKQEKIFYYLFDNGEQTAEKLIEIGKLESKDSFYTLKQRQKENLIVSRKEGTTSYYDLSNEAREKIQLQIDQRKRQLEEEKRIQLKEQIDEEKSENKILEIKNLISKHKTIKRKENSVYLDLKELLELDPAIYEELKEHPEETIKLFKIALEDFGFEGMPLRFSNFSETLEPRSIESLRSSDIDKLHLIKARVSSLSDVRPQIINVKYECPSCGTLITVPQIEKKIREPVRCSCGRKGGFKPISRDLIDRAKCEFQDLVDLTESPQTREISSFIKDHLTESKELSKFNPGNEVKVLCVLKSVENTSGGFKNTSLDLYLDVLEVEPFEEILDLNSFSEEEIKQFEELSAEVGLSNSLDRIKESYAPEIVGNDAPKEALILKEGQGKGRKNKSNIAFIGDPGVAKSVMMKTYQRLTPGSSYVSGATSSTVGLTATVEKKDEGWILKPGVLPTTREDVLLDEGNLIPDEEKAKLQEAMSEGCVTINKASIHAKLKVPCGIIGGYNPEGGTFDENKNITTQFNIPSPILNRYDAVFVIRGAKNKEEDEKIAQKMLKREEKQIQQEFSDEFLKRFFLYVRNQPEPNFNKNLEDYIPKRYSEIKNEMLLIDKKKLINPRFVLAIIRFSKAMAKLKMSNSVTEQDVDFVLNLLKETYLDFNFVGGNPK